MLLDRYAELLVKHGLNVQKGKVVCVTAEVVHRKLVQKVVQHAYRAGAKYVHVDLIDVENTKCRLVETQDEENLKYLPSFIQARYNDLVNLGACNLRIDGSEDPDILAEIPSKKVNTQRLHFTKQLQYFYDEGIGKAKVQWTVAAAATPKWAKKVFPNLSSDDAENALWQEIFRACRVDRPDCLAFWKEHNIRLQTRAKMLTDLQISKLHFTGPGTDLEVFLSKKARFKGGADKSASGFEFEPNIPTEECFTTPDCRYTQGKVSVTRPIFVNGKVVEGLSLEFVDGKIVSFDAASGKEQFSDYIASDEGAKRLGEVALVDISSPIFQSGHIYHNILYDENAACHIAVGFAYHFCLKDAASMTDAELEAIGYNKSNTHLDMMISSEEVDVTATTYDGKTVPLITQGRWVYTQTT